MPATSPPPHRSPSHWAIKPVWWLCALMWANGSTMAASPAAGDAHGATAAPAAHSDTKENNEELLKRKVGKTPAPTMEELGERLRANLEAKGLGAKSMSVQLKAPPKGNKTGPVEAIHDIPAVPGRLENPATNRQLARAKAAATLGHEGAAIHGGHGAEAHWSYEGDTGPQAWGQMKPEFATCASGKRQSPINIEDTSTLMGPAEPLQFGYQPSTGSVVNNGHTIQVDVLGDNTLTVRGSVYRLVQFHFHHPAEEQVNHRSFAMVAHLVHKNAEGQLAVVAVLMEPGEASSVLNKVWTYMPLDVNDRVRMPFDALNLNELLPKDQRYYQFMGSLTTPPCSENVLWMVLKTPATLSRDQLRLFAQLFPHNARPVQPVNGRPVRNAQ
ncbi:MAG: hypothetical protein RLZZ591_1203 [Pseudomonadota bacterium]